MHLDVLIAFEHFGVMKNSSSTLLRTRVESSRYEKAQKVFNRLGMKPGDAVNLFFAQVALRDDLPFVITTHPERLQSDEEQAQSWNQTFGEY